MAEQYTILIIDDEESVLKAIKRTLRNDNYRILISTSADEAVDILRESKVDMVISDHLMPEISGLEFIKKIRVLYPGIIRIILTGHADMEIAISAINDGEIYKFITKPWDNAELKQIVKTAFEKLEAEKEKRILLLNAQDQMKKAVKDIEGAGCDIQILRDKDGAIVLDKNICIDDLQDLLKKK